MVADLLWEAASLMLIGMATVFAFLWLLVLSTQLLSHIVQRHFPTPISEKLPIAEQPVHNGVSPAIVAAISAALHQHRNQK